jgi:hypothetical protein
MISIASIENSSLVINEVLKHFNITDHQIHKEENGLEYHEFALGTARININIIIDPDDFSEDFVPEDTVPEIRVYNTALEISKCDSNEATICRTVDEVVEEIKEIM